MIAPHGTHPQVIILGEMDPPVTAPSEVGPQAIVAQATDPPAIILRDTDPQVIILIGMDPPVTADSSSQRVLSGRARRNGPSSDRPCRS